MRPRPGPNPGRHRPHPLQIPVMLPALLPDSWRSLGEVHLNQRCDAGVAQLVCAVLWPGDIVGISLGALATVIGVLLGAAWLPQPPPSGVTLLSKMICCICVMRGCGTAAHCSIALPDQTIVRGIHGSSVAASHIRCCAQGANKTHASSQMLRWSAWERGIPATACAPR